jgi:hypothetical protein
MAAPVWVKSSAGVVDTTGAFTASLVGVAVGNLIVFQVNADGDTDFNAVTFTDTNNTIEDLAGTDNTMTAIAAQAIGSSVSSHWLWLGRALATTVSIDASTAGEDVYCQIHEFSGVHTGTLITDVIENVTAGSFVNGTGTTTPVADTGVTTLGADRLACNFYATNDDVQSTFASFMGETGGDWILRTSFGSATGTDAAVALQTATIAAAGTINGGSDAITSGVSWGNIGFALIPAVVGGAVEDPYPYIAGGYFPTEG